MRHVDIGSDDDEGWPLGIALLDPQRRNQHMGEAGVARLHGFLLHGDRTQDDGLDQPEVAGTDGEDDAILDADRLERLRGLIAFGSARGLKRPEDEHRQRAGQPKEEGDSHAGKHDRGRPYAERFGGKEQVK